MEFNPFKKKENHSRLATAALSFALAFTAACEKENTANKNLPETTNKAVAEKRIENKPENKTENKSEEIYIGEETYNKLQKFFEKKGDFHEDMGIPQRQYDYTDSQENFHSFLSDNRGIRDYIFIKNQIDGKHLFVYDIDKNFARLRKLKGEPQYSETAKKSLEEFIHKVSAKN